MDSRNRRSLRKTVFRTGRKRVVTRLLGGCDIDGGISAGVGEKPAAPAALNPWQRQFVAKGAVASGFTPDVVYIAMGRPHTVDLKSFPAGHVELWAWNHPGPHIDAVHGACRQPFITESADQLQAPTMSTSLDAEPNGPSLPQIPGGMSPGGGESVAKIGGPLGGSMEPTIRRSSTIRVLFAGGKVVRIGAEENFK